MIDSNVGTSALSRGELPAEMLPVSTADCGQSNGYLAPFILKFSGILAVFMWNLKCTQHGFMLEQAVATVD